MRSGNGRRASSSPIGGASATNRSSKKSRRVRSRHCYVRDLIPIPVGCDMGVLQSVVFARRRPPSAGCAGPVDDIDTVGGVLFPSARTGLIAAGAAATLVLLTGCGGTEPARTP